MNQKWKGKLPVNFWRNLRGNMMTASRAIFRLVGFNMLSPITLGVARPTSTNINRILKPYRRWWFITDHSFRYYVIGQIIFFVGLLLQKVTVGYQWPKVVQGVGATMLCLGFITWIGPTAYRLFVSTAGKWLTRVIHAFFIIFALALARTIVAKALQMPPQYFDLTVGLVALLAYVPIFIFAITACLIAVFARLYISWAMIKMIPALANPLWSQVLMRSRRLRVIMNKWQSQANKLYFHALGVISLIFVTANCIDGSLNLLERSFPLIRWFAYMADFQPAGNYPGVTCEGRIRLLDNGVVEVAKKVGHDIEFHMESFKTDADVSHGCIEPVKPRVLLK